jgi:hypothetical protein
MCNGAKNKPVIDDLDLHYDEVSFFSTLKFKQTVLCCEAHDQFCRGAVLYTDTD